MLNGLGDKLKMARVNQKLSRKQVADLLDISISTIGLYESGERLPSLPVLVKLATHYKVSIDYLLDFDNSNKQCLSLDGLSEKQIRALKLTADCFRNNKSEY